MNNKYTRLLARVGLIVTIIGGLAGPFSSQGSSNSGNARLDAGGRISSLDQANAAGSGPLLITEILANADNESTGEVIEIKNISTKPVDLSTWTFADSSDKRHDFMPYPRDLSIGQESTILQPDQLALVLDKDYAGEYDAQISAQQPLPNLVSTVSGNLYLANTSDRVALIDNTGNISDDFSWAKDIGNSTPFARTLSDQGVWSDLAADLKGPSLGFVRSGLTTPISPPAGLVISELLPNPKGSDTAEFIELFNSSAQKINLAGFNIRDLSGKKYDLSGLLDAAGYLALKQTTTGITLNNTSDELSLYFGDKLIESTYYENTKEGLSWSLFDNDFAWTLSPTPGKANLLAEPGPVNPDPTDNKKTPDPIKVDKIADLLEMDQGSLVQIKGITATKKDLFFKNSFHLVDKTGGLIITLSDDDKTMVEPGQKMSLQGKLTVLSGMPRLLVDAVPKIEGKAPIPIKEIQPKKFGLEQIGQMVRLKGRVTTRAGKSFRLTDKDTSKTVLISIRKKTGITQKAPPKDRDVVVTGLALKSGEQIVLAPRSASDIKSGDLLASGATFWPLLFLSALFSLLVMVLSVHHAQHWGQSKNSGDSCGR